MNRHIVHPSHITWRVPLHTETKDIYFSSALAKNVEKTEKILTELGYTIVTEAAQGDALKAFTDRYTNFLTHKPRGRVFSVTDRITEGTTEGKIYTLFSLYNKEKVLVGGLLISENPTTRRITTVFKTIPHSLPERKRFPESLAYVFTYRFYAYALQKNYEMIFHGTDRNPYGVYSNIGLGLFKIRASAFPVVSGKSKVSFLDTITYDTSEDILLWVGDTPDTTVTKAILITSLSPDKARSAYKPLWSIPHLTIELWDHEAYISSLRT